ncbi:MAG: hypothetical protein V1793_04640 [Pseudomonadota bacterium]
MTPTIKIVRCLVRLFGLFSAVMIAADARAAAISVSSFEGLQTAVATASPGDTILMQDGLYQMAGTWSVAVRTRDLTVRGASGNREAVVLRGMGMNAADHNGLWISAGNVTIQDMTIEQVRNHCIQTDIDVDGLVVRNCILRDAGEQILKVPVGSDPGNHSENGLVEGCLFEYSAGVGPRSYMGGIDVHRGLNWIVRDTVFRHIRSPGPTLAEHAIHFWNDSRGTLVERNLIITCDRGIGFGLGSSTHGGGIIRNNMIYHDGTPGFNDGGILLESAWDAVVANNTIFLLSDYPNAIEYRFAATTNVLIANNLANRAILRRDGASATLATNVTQAFADWFVDAAAGDLHLASNISQAIDQGTIIPQVEDDFDKQARAVSGHCDVGADEFFPCVSDLDEDGDIDGSDLKLYSQEIIPECLQSFSAEFGKQ